MGNLEDKLGEAEKRTLEYGVRFGLFFGAAIVANAPGAAPKDIIIGELLLELSRNDAKLAPIIEVVMADLKSGKTDGKAFIQCAMDVLGIKEDPEDTEEQQAIQP